MQWQTKPLFTTKKEREIRSLSCFEDKFCIGGFHLFTKFKILNLRFELILPLREEFDSY